MSPRLLKLLLLASLSVLAGLGVHTYRLHGRYSEARRNAALGLESIRSTCRYVARMLDEGPIDEDRIRLAYECIGTNDKVDRDEIAYEFGHREGPALAKRIRERMRRGRLPAWYPRED